MRSDTDAEGTGARGVWAGVQTVPPPPPSGRDDDGHDMARARLTGFPQFRCSFEVTVGSSSARARTIG